MPIKTKIDVDANPESLKASVALFEKYQAALKKQWGDSVANAPYIKAASEAAKGATKFLKQEESAAKAATDGQGKLAAGAQKAGSAFSQLASGVKLSIESLTRYALSPLQILFPAGLAVGLGAL